MFREAAKAMATAKAFKENTLKKVSDDSGLGWTTVLWRISIVLTFIGLVMYIVGFSTDRWASLDNEDYAPIVGAKVNAHFGLWRKCITITTNESQHVLVDGCEDMDNDDSYKPAAKVLCSAGLILCIFGLPIAILAGCGHSPRTMVFGGTFTVVGGIVAVVGCVVYIGKAIDSDDRLEPEYSMFLAIIGAALVAIGGVFQVVSTRTGYLTLA